MRIIILFFLALTSCCAALPQALSETDRALIEDAAVQAELALGAPPPAGVQIVAVERAQTEGDVILSTQARRHGKVLRVVTRTDGPPWAVRETVFFVVPDASPPMVIPSLPGGTRTRPALQSEIAPAVQRAAAERSGEIGACRRDRDMPVIDTVVTEKRTDGGWEEIWKVRLCSGAEEWVTIAMTPTQEATPDWEIR